MVSLVVVDREGHEHRIETSVGHSLMESIRDADVGELAALCGGCCACATCHVYVAGTDAAMVTPQGEAEDELLSATQSRQPGSRLSCQMLLTEASEGLRVHIAPSE